MALFSGKTIIFGAPKPFNLDKVIENELQNLGFITTNISFYDKRQFKYKNILQRLECFAMKNFLWQRDYKANIAFRNNSTWILAKLAEVDVADYILIIRPDLYPIAFIKALRKKGKKIIAYQWDGLDRFPKIYKYIHLFDRFFVFNGKDLKTTKILPITNFYPISFGKNLFDKSLQSDVYYSGVYLSERVDDTSKLINACQTLGMNVKYHLFAKNRDDNSTAPGGLITRNQPIDYHQNIQHTYNTKVILDLVSPAHEGLSFRFFEAIGFEKKLITTNPRVKEYDLYHPNNIFVWGNNQNLEDLKEFFERPYSALAREIQEKYSFENWIKYALDEGDYKNLNIPI